MSTIDTEAHARARDLAARLIAVAERAKAGFETIAGEFDLTATQARALLFLVEPAPMSQVAEHLACDPSNVTGIADRLAARDLIERVPGHDRRVKHLRLTAQGQTLRSSLADRLGERATVNIKLEVHEQDQLKALLEKLLAP